MKKKENFSFWLDLNLKPGLKKLAEKKERSMAWVINKSIEEFINKNLNKEN